MKNNIVDSPFDQKHAASLELLLEMSENDLNGFINSVLRGLVKIHELEGAAIYTLEKSTYRLRNHFSIPDDLKEVRFQPSKEGILPVLPDVKSFLMTGCDALLIARSKAGKINKLRISPAFLLFFSRIIKKKKSSFFREKYDDYFFSSRAPLFRLDYNGTIIEANDACRHFIEYTSKEPGSADNIIGTHFTQIVYPDQINRIRKQFKELYKKGFLYIRNGLSTELEPLEQIVNRAKEISIASEPVKVLKRDGTIIEAVIDVSLAIDEKATITGFICTAIDKTDQFRAENALRFTENRYKSIIDRSPVSSFLTDTEGNVFEINTTVTSNYGYTLTDLPLNYSDLIYKNDLERAFNLFNNFFEKSAKLKKSFDIARLETDQEYKIECYNRLMEVSIKNEDLRIYNRDRDQIFDIIINTELIIDFQDFQIKGSFTTSTDVTQENRLESKLNSVLESIGEGYYEIDLEGNFTFFNDSMCRILGYDKEELLMINYRDHVLRGLNEVKDYFQEVFASGESRESIDCEIVRKNGEVRYVETSISLYYDNIGEKKGFRGTLRDITRRKRTEQALMQSEEKYRELFKNMPIFSMLFDAAGNLIECNDITNKVWGAPLEGKGFRTTDFVHEDSLGKGTDLYRKIYRAADAIRSKWSVGNISREECYRQLRQLSIIDEELKVRDQTERIYFIKFNAALWIDRETLDVRGMLTTAVDITEKKQLEEKLIESERKYREIVEEKTRDIIFSADGEGKFVTANINLYHKLGYSEEDVIGKPMTEIIYRDPDDIGGVNEATVLGHIQKVLVDGIREVRFNTMCMHKSLAEPIVLQFKLEPTLENDRVIGLVGFASDPTEDYLREYLVKEDVTYCIDNKLTLTEDISYRLTRDLVKYFTNDQINLIRFGLREIIINAVEHGNLEITYDEKTRVPSFEQYIDLIKERRNDPVNIGKMVSIDFSLNEERVQYTVRDEGSGFDYRAMLSQNISLINEMYLQHGRGLLTARGIFDRLEFNDAGNEVTLVKYVRKQ